MQGKLKRISYRIEGTKKMRRMEEGSVEMRDEYGKYFGRRDMSGEAVVRLGRGTLPMEGHCNRA